LYFMTDKVNPPSVFLKVMKDLYSALRGMDDPNVYSLGDAAAKELAGAYIDHGFECEHFYKMGFNGFNKEKVDVMDKKKLDKVFGSRIGEVLRAAYEFGKYCAMNNMDLNNYIECMWPDIEKMDVDAESDDDTKADFWDYGKEILEPLSHSKILDKLNYTHKKSS
jgi:hypothetical protein